MLCDHDRHLEAASQLDQSPHVGNHEVPVGYHGHPFFLGIDNYQGCLIGSEFKGGSKSSQAPFAVARAIPVFCPLSGQLMSGKCPAQTLTELMSWYRPPAAKPLGALSSIRARSLFESFTPAAAIFSSRYLRRLVPGIGTISS